jgi:hypothetical protein
MQEDGIYNFLAETQMHVAYIRLLLNPVQSCLVSVISTVYLGSLTQWFMVVHM